MSVAGVQKELAMFALVYNLVRLLMLRAAYDLHVSVERVSFGDSLRWLTSVSPRCPLARLVVHPHRAGRIEPRVKKGRPKEYDLMKRPRDQLKQALLRQKNAA